MTHKETILFALTHPQCLLGSKEPPIDALWGFCYGVYSVLENDDKKLVAFFKHKNYGSRTEYRIMMDHYHTFQDQREYLLSFWAEYFEWIEKSAT